MALEPVGRTACAAARALTWQAGELVRRFEGCVDERALEAAAVFAALSSRPPIVRQWTAWRHGLRKAGFVRNLGFYCLM